MSKDCMQDLQKVAYNVIKVKTNDDITTDTYDYYFTDKFVEDVKKGSFAGSMGIPLPDGGPIASMNADASAEEINKFRERVARIGKTSFKKNFTVDLLRVQVPKHFWDAYIACVEAPANSDIAGSIKAEGRYVIVTLSFQPANIQDDLPTINDVWTMGLEPSLPLTFIKDAEIPVGGLAQQYVWPVGSTPRKQSFTVTTSRGSFTGHVIPSDLAGPTDPPPPVRKLRVTCEMSNPAGTPQVPFSFEDEFLPGQTRYYPNKDGTPFGADHMKGYVSVDEAGRYELGTSSVHTNFAWVTGGRSSWDQVNASSSWCHIRVEPLGKSD